MTLSLLKNHKQKVENKMQQNNIIHYKLSQKLDYSVYNGSLRSWLGTGETSNNNSHK